MDSKLYGTRLYVHRKSISQNIKYFQDSFPKIDIMAVVKANAYGHGDIEFCQELKSNNIKLFSVADFEEGLRLRKVFSHIRIMVMNPGINNINTIVQNKLEPVIYNKRVMSEIISSTKKNNNTINVHVKLNTGMNRWGLNTEELIDVIKVLKQNKKITIQSIYSHLSSAKNPKLDSFSHNQLNKLYSIKNCTGLIKHVFSSHGSLRLLEKNSDTQIIRLGLGIYGGLKHPNLEPVSELKCTINQIRTVKRGEGVGYNRSFIAANNTKVGVIAFGYADGIQRNWGNGLLKFYFQGKLLPTIGDISMDSCTIDLSQAINICEGDELIYFGRERPIWKLAEELDTIPYEIIATLSRRIKRIYIN